LQHFLHPSQESTGAAKPKTETNEEEKNLVYVLEKTKSGDARAEDSGDNWEHMKMEPNSSAVSIKKLKRGETD
jgi:hypothetical protein